MRATRREPPIPGSAAVHAHAERHRVIHQRRIPAPETRLRFRGLSRRARRLPDDECLWRPGLRTPQSTQRFAPGRDQDETLSLRRGDRGPVQTPEKLDLTYLRRFDAAPG